MALTPFQRSICRHLAPSRKERESYVAGGLARNALLDTARLSVGIDLFHDTAEARDWVDVVACCESLQPLGFLVWAACGKDPGFNPFSLLQQVRRSSRYTQDELDELDFDASPPDAAKLGARWHGFLDEAERIIGQLPFEQVGRCVMVSGGGLCREVPEDAAGLVFHQGRIGGALPSFP